MGSGMLCLSSRSDITAAATICRPYFLQPRPVMTPQPEHARWNFITNDFLNGKTELQKMISAWARCAPAGVPVVAGYLLPGKSLFSSSFSICGTTQVININITKLVCQ